MSSYEQFARLSPPSFYLHSPLNDAGPPASLSFTSGHPRTQLHPQANPAPSSSKQPDDMYFIEKYKDMKRKVEEIELDNDRLHLKCLKARKNIQRLRLERAILYESLSTIPVPESSQHPGVHPYPSSDLVQAHQEHQQHTLSPNGQARIHPDPPRVPPETVHHARSPHQPPQGVDPHRPPHRPYDDPPPISNQQPGVIVLGTPHLTATKPRQRRSKADTTSEKNQSAKTRNEVRNGGARTFPFVHEYSSAQKQVEPVFTPPEYPSEIRFHQYEGLSERRTVNRSRDRDTDKGNKHKRRTPQEIEKDRRRRAGSRSCSPTEPSQHGSHASPIQNPVTSVVQETQPCPAEGDERDRDPNSTKIQHPLAHFDDSSQQPDAKSKFPGPREGDERCIQKEYKAETEGEKPRDSVWQPPAEKKRAYSQMDHEDRYAKGNEEGNEPNRTQRKMPRRVARADDDGYSLPRVREGEVMD